MPKEIFESHQYVVVLLLFFGLLLKNSRYTGLRKTFLDRQCAVYMQLREKTIKKELPMPKLEAYVVVIVTMYFETFPWWMAEDEEPGENFKGLEPKDEEAETRKEETIKQHSGVRRLLRVYCSSY